MSEQQNVENTEREEFEKDMMLSTEAEVLGDMLDERLDTDSNRTAVEPLKETPEKESVDDSESAEEIVEEEPEEESMEEGY